MVVGEKKKTKEEKLTSVGLRPFLTILLECSALRSQPRLLFSVAVLLKNERKGAEAEDHWGVQVQRY